MSALLILLGVGIGVVVTVAVLGPWLRLVRAVNIVLVERANDHRDCVDRVLWHVQGEFAGVVLEDAANRWSSAKTRQQIERRLQTWKPGDEGPTPHWLREQAQVWRERSQP